MVAGINHVHTLSAELVTQQIKKVITDHKLDLSAVKSVADCAMSEHPVYKLTNSDTRDKRGILHLQNCVPLLHSVACLM